jgi:spermidine/putrescine-binding protein
MAYAWAQLSLSPKTQQAFAEQIYFGPTNSKVVLTGDAAETMVYGQEESGFTPPTEHIHD